MLTLLDMLLNTLSIRHDLSQNERTKRLTITLWALVFLIAVVVANVT